MKTRVHIGDHTLTFTSDMARHAFFERNKGKHAYLVIDDQPSAQMRRYFEGAVVPAVFYQHPNSGWVDFGECREALKLEFLPTRFVHGLTRARSMRVALSTADLSKERFRALLEQVTNWMVENGLEVPDPEEYKAWRDSAPPAGVIYPQLLRLKTKYDILNT